MDDSLGLVLIAAGLELPKVLVPTLPQSTSNVNMNVPENQINCILYLTNFLEH